MSGAIKAKNLPRASENPRSDILAANGDRKKSVNANSSWALSGSDASVAEYARKENASSGLRLKSAIVAEGTNRQPNFPAFAGIDVQNSEESPVTSASTRN